MEWLQTLRCGAGSCEIAPRFCHQMTGKLSTELCLCQMGTFFDSENDKVVKGEGWAPPFIC